MNKSQASPPDISSEANLMSALAPMQESLERFRRASGLLTETCTEIAAEQTTFLQRALFDSLDEIQALRQARVPAELFKTSIEFACEQSERWWKAVSEIGTEAFNCWFDVLKAAPTAITRDRQHHAAQ